MTDATRIAARSNHGCWTCRLRRKKCDETHPACLACTSLELECHGYGPRPEWMDNGDLQRDQATRFKLLVSQTTARKGRRRQQSTYLPDSGLQVGTSISTSHVFSPTSSTPAFHEQHIEGLSQERRHFPDVGSGIDHLLAVNSVPSPRFSSLDAANEQLNAFPQDEFHLPGGGLGLDPLINPSWNPWPTINAPMLESPSKLLDHDFTTISSLSSNSTQQAFSPRSSEGTVMSPTDLTMLYDAGEKGSSMAPWNYRHCEHQTRDTSTINEIQYSARHPSTRLGEATHTACVGSPVPMSLGGASEDELFMFYLDQVFYAQFPFYHGRTKQGRGWLFSILRRVKSAYHATLALSQRHFFQTTLQSSDLTNSLVQLRVPESHYAVALNELQKMVHAASKSYGSLEITSSLEICMSILQILFFEIFNGGKEKWQMHLHTAFQFVPILLQARGPMGILDATPPIITNEHAHLFPIYTEMDYAVRFLLGAFVSFDILSSASTRSCPSSAINHLQVLDAFGVSLERFLGCSNSVMALILEIAMLDEWKTNAQSANKLSVVNLAKRSHLIRERLRQELAVNRTHTSMERPILGSPLFDPQSCSHPEIVKIFTLSAITYLEVIVSGAYPEVPEIAESVAETISAFQGLKDPKDLRSVVWPFCITGCMAQERHYDFFRGLVSRAGINQWSIGTCSEALQIMEECWKARVISSDSCDWVTSMKRRGCYVLLV